MSKDEGMEAIRWTRWPAEEWRDLCNGPQAYTNKAPAMLSVAVVREEALLAENKRLTARVAELEAQVLGLTGDAPPPFVPPMSPEEAKLFFSLLDAAGESPEAAANVGRDILAWGIQRKLFPEGSSEDEVLRGARKMAQEALAPKPGSAA